MFVSALEFHEKAKKTGKNFLISTKCFRWYTHTHIHKCMIPSIFRRASLVCLCVEINEIFVLFFLLKQMFSFCSIYFFTFSLILILLTNYSGLAWSRIRRCRRIFYCYENLSKKFSFSIIICFSRKWFAVFLSSSSSMFLLIILMKERKTSTSKKKFSRIFAIHCLKFFFFFWKRIPSSKSYRLSKRWWSWYHDSCQKLKILYWKWEEEKKFLNFLKKRFAIPNTNRAIC